MEKLIVSRSNKNSAKTYVKTNADMNFNINFKTITLSFSH
jgi:hypothetical protein